VSMDDSERFQVRSETQLELSHYIITHTKHPAAEEALRSDRPISSTSWIKSDDQAENRTSVALASPDEADVSSSHTKFKKTSAVDAKG
jgi:hypothetical protein